MATMTFPDPMNGNPPNAAENPVIGRRAAALNLASSLWPSSSDMFAEEFLTDSLEDETIEMGRLLARVEAHKAGHALHTQLVSRLLADPSLWTITTGEAARPEADAYLTALAPASATD